MSLSEHQSLPHCHHLSASVDAFVLAATVTIVTIPQLRQTYSSCDRLPQSPTPAATDCHCHQHQLRQTATVTNTSCDNLPLSLTPASKNCHCHQHQLRQTATVTNTSFDRLPLSPTPASKNCQSPTPPSTDVFLL